MFNSDFIFLQTESHSDKDVSDTTVSETVDIVGKSTSEGLILSSEQVSEMWRHIEGIIMCMRLGHFR